jgi:hypothetical protein
MDKMFSPPKRPGLLFHLIVLIGLLIGSTLTFIQANRAEVGMPLVFSLVGFFLFAFPLPLFVYRMYALLRADYRLSPEGIRLTWGMRSEEIPMQNILWLSPLEHLESSLPLPWLRWPGAVLGTRRVGSGEVEYLAVRGSELVIIATPGKMYAISPENRETFIQAFQRQAEIGTLNPIQSRSIYPTFLLGSVWSSRPARYTLIAGLLLCLLLLVWITLTTEPDSTLLIARTGNLRPLTATQLLLLPIINTLFYFFDLFLGLFFYRREESRPLAFLLWCSSVLTSILFFLALYFAVSAA